MKRYILLSISLFICSFLWAQNTQTIKGRVIDAESKQAIIGASVFVENPTLIGTSTDIDGYFKLNEVPTGKVSIKCTSVGYESYISSPISLTTGKELNITIELSEQIIKTDEVVIKGTKRGQAKNESLTVSAKSFDIKETQKFAASLNDPGRVVLNYPGVQAGQDNNNDVMVRGNSPVGVLWRLEGIDVPNLNHFSRPGSSGGGITALSPNVLSRSDFSTGAFSAEYGNAFSSAFDIKFRKGNNERHEFTTRIGIIGLNFGAEGPFSKKNKSSYLFNYRYSTLSLLGAMGVHVVSPDTRNDFQDFNFNINIDTKKKARINIFGVGGLSAEITDAKKDTSLWKKWSDRKQIDFISNLGVAGLAWTQLLNNKSFVKTVVAFSYNDVLDANDTINYDAQFFNIDSLRATQYKIALHSFYQHKFSSKLALKTGLIFDQYIHNFYFKEYNFVRQEYDTKINGKGNTQIIQPYAQLKYRISNKSSLIGGLRAIYLSLNSTYSVEPRLSFVQKIGKAHQISLAYGLHSQVLPLGSYYQTEKDNLGNTYFPNWELEMIKSHHLVAAYNVMFAKNYQIKIEPYFQYLYDVPVSVDSTNTEFLLNNRKGFATKPMTSQGKGMNYGVDFSFEKFYTHNWFMLFNASLSQSKFQPLDGNWYNTFYDNRFGISAMGGYEIPFKKRSSALELALRLQFSGGFRATPIDPVASALQRKAVYRNTNPFSETLPHYFRPDFRIAFKQNLKKFSWNISLDLANFVNYKNILQEDYDLGKNEIYYRYQTGLTPILAFQFDFYKTVKK